MRNVLSTQARIDTSCGRILASVAIETRKTDPSSTSHIILDLHTLYCQNVYITSIQQSLINVKQPLVRLDRCNASALNDLSQLDEHWITGEEDRQRPSCLSVAFQ